MDGSFLSRRIELRLWPIAVLVLLVLWAGAWAGGLGGSGAASSYNRFKGFHGRVAPTFGEGADYLFDVDNIVRSLYWYDAPPSPLHALLGAIAAVGWLALMARYTTKVHTYSRLWPFDLLPVGILIGGFAGGVCSALIHLTLQFRYDMLDAGDLAVGFWIGCMFGLAVGAACAVVFLATVLLALRPRRAEAAPEDAP